MTRAVDRIRDLHPEVLASTRLPPPSIDSVDPSPLLQDIPPPETTAILNDEPQVDHDDWEISGNETGRMVNALRPPTQQLSDPVENIPDIPSPPAPLDIPISRNNLGADTGDWDMISDVSRTVSESTTVRFSDSGLDFDLSDTASHSFSLAGDSDTHASVIVVGEEEQAAQVPRQTLEDGTPILFFGTSSWPFSMSAT